MNNRTLLAALSNRRAFIVYRLIPGENGKTDKVPFDPLTGRNIDAQDSVNWLLPSEAEEHLEVWTLAPEAHVLGYGIGLVIHPDSKLFFLDLDSCRTPEGGWQPHAIAFLERFPKAMREVSVSNTGLHVFGSYAGERPLHRVRNKDYRAELYTGGRFAALGHSESGDLFADCTFELSQFIGQFFPPRDESEHGDEWRNTPVDAWKGPESDDDLISRAIRSTSVKAAVLGRAGFKDLWTRNVEALAVSFPPEKDGSAYNASSADLALLNHLAFWTGSNCERMLRLLMRDDCMMRREKWARVDNYLVPSILRAVADQTEWYKGGTKELPPPPPNPWGAPVQGVPVPPDSVVAVMHGVSGTVEDLTAYVNAPREPMPAPPPPDKVGFLPATQAPHALTLDGKNRYEASLPNLIQVLGLQQLAVFGFDTFRGQIMVKMAGGEWHTLADVDLVNLREALERQNFGSISGSMMRDSLLAVATRNSYDSAIVWLNGLAWDGVQRIDNFLHTHCGAVDDAYTRAVSRYIWTGLPCRVFEPGCQLDMVPVFQSTQGTRKSSGLLALSPSKDYFTDSVAFTKDDDNFKRAIRGKLVIEIPELVGLGKAEVESIKRMITRRDERWTEKWQVLETVYPRRGMFFGSTNNIQFLPQDETGHRRWLPVEIVSLDDVLITRDREQLWAEGKVRWASLKNQGLPGVDFHEAEQLAKAKHQRYEQSDTWEVKIKNWLETPIEAQGQTLMPAPCTRPLHISEVLEGAIRMTTDKMNRSAEIRAANVMRALGYAKKQMRLPGFKNPVDRWVLSE